MRFLIREQGIAEERDCFVSRCLYSQKYFVQSHRNHRPAQNCFSCVLRDPASLQSSVPADVLLLVYGPFSRHRLHAIGILVRFDPNDDRLFCPMKIDLEGK